MRPVLALAAGTNLLEIPIDVQLQQVCRRVARTSCSLGDSMGKPQGHKIKALDVGIDKPNRVVVRTVLIDPFGNQQDLIRVHYVLDEQTAVRAPLRGWPEKIVDQPTCGGVPHDRGGRALL